MPVEPFRQGPRSQIAILEHHLRKTGRLADGSHLIEWKQGQLRKLRLDGVAQQPPHMPFASKIRPLQGASSCSYSSTTFYLWTSKRTFVAPLALVWRIASVEPRSLHAVFTEITGDGDHHLISFSWQSQEVKDDFEDLRGFAVRVIERQQLAPELTPEWRDWIDRTRAVLGRGLLDSEIAAVSETHVTQL